MRVEAVPHSEQAALPPIERGFLVEGHLVLQMRGGLLAYDVVADAEPYWKTYIPPALHAREAEWATFIALEGGAVLGRIDVSRHWTGLACLDDLAVNLQARRKGIAEALLTRAKRWALELALPGITVETQHNNVAACSLYAKAGFRLAGFDSQLYSTIGHLENEIALFWYWRSGNETP